MDMVKSLRVHAGLPQAAWGELVSSACFIHKRLPTTANNDNESPYEIFHNAVPDLSVIRVIECKCCS